MAFFHVLVVSSGSSFGRKLVSIIGLKFIVAVIVVVVEKNQTFLRLVSASSSLFYAVEQSE